MLGMYVHTHWGYNRPYSARRWTVPDWEGYLEGLSRLGFDTVKVWPQIDTMPLIPTSSDAAYLRTLAQATEIAHVRFGMKVILVLTANCMGNERAAGYAFHNRPYFICEKKVNPGDADEVDALIAQRQNALAFVPNADAIAIIDSDPGGFAGSTNEAFVDLCVRQMDVFRTINPAAEFVYWMLVGWETYCRFWEAQVTEDDPEPTPWAYQNPSDFVDTLTLLQARMPEPWWLTGYLDLHTEAIDHFGLRDRAMYYPYGTIEGEPVFPLTVCGPLRSGGIEERLTPEATAPYRLGVMGNAQTHCLQLPHTYWFAHRAQGGTMATADLAEFAERLLPGLGETVAAAWDVIESTDSGQQLESARQLRAAVGVNHRLGDLDGLLFGDPDRFLLDLAMNLELRAALSTFGQAVEGDRDARPELSMALEKFAAYQQRVGFIDAYGGPLVALLNRPLAKLGDPGLDAVLHDFEDWRNPAVRNGIVPRLIDAMEHYVTRG